MRGFLPSAGFEIISTYVSTETADIGLHPETIKVQN